MLEPEILSPVDLHCIKACGVTFAASTIERVIEEHARGNPEKSLSIRNKLEKRLGGSLKNIIPGSKDAESLKNLLIHDGLWSQYLEVAIGPYAEIFTKAPVLSAIGFGGQIGVRSDSCWNNPEPEIVLIVNGFGQAIGATLGNDVNLRDLEGRSALLLGKAKDNNASCAIGPLIRLFDDHFTMSDIRQAEVTLKIDGADGYRLEGSSNMSEISRDPLELVRQTLSEHNYPDGFALFLGTLFTPVQDRDIPGAGFTHKTGDLVTISSQKLGTLRNTVATCDAAPPWTTGIAAFYEIIAKRQTDLLLP